MRRSSSIPSVSPGRRVDRYRRKHLRSNSIGAFSCRREACTVATSDLCRMYRLSLEIPPPSLVDNLITSNNTSIDRHECALSHIQTHQSALTDLPSKFVRISRAHGWDFDIFALERQSSPASANHLVCCLGLHLFDAHNLFNSLQLNRLMVARALVAIASAYWSHNPYHTAVHAADVLQATHCFLSQPTLYGLFTPAEVLGTLLAALCHDVDHPGLNQTHLQTTGHYLVRLYNSVSVLERHHARVGLSILHQSGLSTALKSSDWSIVRSCLLNLIPATDIALQNMFRMKFARLIETRNSQPDYSYSDEDRLLLLQMCLKCADVSNPTRTWSICRQWAQLVCSEFFSQGDQEKARWSLLPVASCDRTLSTVPAIQISFIENLVRPLFSDWDRFFQTPLTNEILQTLDSNRVKWELLASPAVWVGVAQPHSSFSSTGDSAQHQLARKVMKSSALSKPQHHSVKFSLNPSSSMSKKKILSTNIIDTDPNNTQATQTYLITTQGLRRHSLPETQGAIRKTFNFAQSTHATNRIQHYLHIKKPIIAKHPRTASGNILQTLCEEIIHHEPSDSGPGRDCFAGGVGDPFPLPDAWNPRKSESMELTKSSLTGVAIDFSSFRCRALTNRRRSVPLLGYRF